MKMRTDPNLIVYFDGQYVPLGEARVGVLTHALNYGTGVFEGIRAYWDEEQEEMFLVRMLEHYQRWKSNCGIIRIEVPQSAEELCEITLELVQRNGLRTDSYVRPLAYKSAERVGVCPDDEDAFSVVAMPYADNLHSGQGIHAGVSSWRKIDDNAIPVRAKICGAYANSALAMVDARRAGFNEAILLNESGQVAEGPASNLFMVRKDKLITPPVTEGILEGITRDSVMELAQQELGMEVVERPIDRSELYICDELFFTGTAVGVTPVVRVDHRAVRDGVVGAATREIRQSYIDATHGRLQAYRKWLTPVYESQRKQTQEEASPEDVNVN